MDGFFLGGGGELTLFKMLLSATLLKREALK